MKIKKIICSPARTGFYFDDQKAIKAGAKMDGFQYEGEPMTEGFTQIRQAGEAISVQIILEDGSIAYGDCAAVQYSGAGGRDPLFLAQDFIPIIEKEIVPHFEGEELDSFKRLAEKLEGLRHEGKKFHTAIRYGLSQALLDAVARAHKTMPCDIVAKEYNCPLTGEPLDIFTQSGDNRYENAEKMIIKQAQVLPHALINNVKTKLGEPDGQILKEYVSWLSKRIQEMRTDDSYKPTLHIDVYGTIGQLFGPENTEAMAKYLKELAKLAEPFQLRIEGPMDSGSREAQIKDLAALTKALDEKNIPVQLVADEWCNTYEDVVDFVKAGAGHMIQIKTPDLGSISNTIEAVLYCKEHGVGAYQGGTCNETDRSAQICTQIAMATRPTQILAKPGMGVDEGYMIVYNEMQRVIAYHKAK